MIYKYVFIIILLLSTNCFSAPSISGVSGTIEHGESIIITGLDFGVKSPAAPTRFEDFESENSLRVGGTDWNDWDILVINGGVASDRSSSGSQSLRINYGADNHGTGSNYSTTGMDVSPVSDAQNIFTFNKLYYTWSGDYHINHKNFWLHGALRGAQGAVSNYSINAIGVQANCGYHYGFFPDMIDYQDQWYSQEWFFEQDSGFGSSDGLFYLWFNNTQYANISDMNYRCSGNTGTEAEQRFYDAGPFYAISSDYPSGTQYIYADDTYIDTQSWAHIIIGNSSTYSSCEHREIQIPSAWSTTSITITFNQGSFVSEDTVYLFVVDADLEVSDGYAVEVGSNESPSTANITTTVGSGNITITINPITGNCTWSLE